MAVLAGAERLQRAVDVGVRELRVLEVVQQLDQVRVVRCDEVQWRFLGLSLAGYNVLISLAMAAIALFGFVRSAKPA